jgi:tetratricopeptide (TPR) repeat protein
VTTHQPASYDLVFFGTDLQGQERLTALKQLAQVMKVPPERLGEVLEQRRGVIARKLTSEKGEEAVRKLSKLGLRCNLRPSTESGVTLELVPAEPAKAADKVLECPACGHQHQVPADQPEPTMCKQCGIVFAKYLQKTTEEQERERLRQSLLAQHQRKLDQEERDRQALEAKERRERLEEEIRRELGLPRAISTPSRLIGSAAGLFLIGLFVGVAAGGVGYNLFFGAERLPPTPAGAPPDAMAAASPPPGLALMDTGMQTQMQIKDLLAVSDPASTTDTRPNEPAATDATANGRTVDDRLSGQGSTPATTDGAGVLGGGGVATPLSALTSLSGNPNTGATRSTTGDGQPFDFLGSRLNTLRTDSEWDLFIISRLDDLRKGGHTKEAALLIEHLRNPDLLFERGAQIADDLRRDGRRLEADETYQRLAAAAERLPDTGGARVAAFCILARHLDNTERATDSEALFRRAEAIAASITNPADRAAADSELAALLSNQGRTELAKASFKAAITDLKQIKNPAERLSAITWIAGATVKAGYRLSALGMLEEARGKVDTIENPQQRNGVLAAMVRAYQLAGDLPDAKGIAARISDRTERDRAIHGLLIAEIASNRLASAIELSEDLQTPAYQALAFGLLSLRQLHSPPYQALALPATERAQVALSAITDPAEKAAIGAELGRFAARRGEPHAADTYFLNSYALAEQIKATGDRDQSLAIIITNEAMALRFATPRSKVKEIADGQLRTNVISDIEKIAKAAQLGIVAKNRST